MSGIPLILSSNVLMSTCSVLKDGELVESGTHDELVVEDGEYNKLFQVQAQAFLSQ